MITNNGETNKKRQYVSMKPKSTEEDNLLELQAHCIYQELIYAV